MPDLPGESPPDRLQAPAPHGKAPDLSGTLPQQIHPRDRR